MAMKRERRRLCKFLSDWTVYDQFSSWLIPVKGDNHKAHCILCKKVFAVSHGGLNDVKAHYKGKRHIWLQRQQQETAEDSSNLWEGHQNFRSKNVGQNIVFNEKTDAIEEVANNTSQSPSSIGEETVGEDSSENGDKYWEFDLDPEPKPLVADSIPESTPSKKMNSQLKMMPQQYCLRWKYHHNNLQAMFSQLLERESYCDVTIACEGKTIRAHKIVLSACSTYFDAIFSQHEEKNPIVILKDVKFSDIKALVEFMYKGEINVDNSHLTSLLKTAEDLHIKGLAEVSWRSDRTGGPPSEESEPSYSHVPPPDNHSDVEQPPSKRRRPRNHQADEDSFNPMVMSVTGAAGTENAFTVREDMIQQHDDEMDETVLDDSEPEVISDDGDDEDVVPYQPTNPFPTSEPAEPEPQESAPVTPAPSSEESILQRISAQYPDVVKLHDYLTTGRRQQFWEEPFTRRVMEAIKGKELEMKIGAELLGVSYGTLYGRYRDAYGCLKHPYRVRDFWSESGPADILAKVQRKEITLFHAAEMLNVTVTTLANYLSTLRQPGGGGGGGVGGGGAVTENNDKPAATRDDEEDYFMGGDEEDEDEEDEDDEQQRPDQPSVTIKLEKTDVVAVKQEAMTNHEHGTEDAEGGRTNNNMDHSDGKADEVNGTDNEVTDSPRITDEPVYNVEVCPSSDDPNEIMRCCKLPPEATPPSVTPPAPSAEYPSVTPPAPNAEYVSKPCGTRVGYDVTTNWKRLQNADETSFGEFPWMLALLGPASADAPDAIVVFQCGATLLHPQVAITAAHCIKNPKSVSYKIRAGDYDTTDTVEALPHQDRQVTSILIHHKYNAKTLYNDVALLFLDTPVSPAINVGTLCLPETDDVFDDQLCVATGWGKGSSEGAGAYSSELKKVDLTVVPPAKCQAELRKTRLGIFFLLDPSFICAVGQRNQDTCSGDGGGPLACPHPLYAAEGRFTLAGLVAWGVGCGNNMPAAYANIARNSHWIDTHMRERGFAPDEPL